MLLETIGKNWQSLYWYIERDKLYIVFVMNGNTTTILDWVDTEIDNEVHNELLLSYLLAFITYFFE